MDDIVPISVARHKTESCMREIGASKRNADRCKRDASNEWIRFGAVAFLWCKRSTLSLSSVATLMFTLSKHVCNIIQQCVVVIPRS